MDVKQKAGAAIRLMDDGLYDESEELLAAVLTVESDNYLGA